MGHFLDFYLTYGDKTSREQAEAIVATATEVLDGGAPGVAILYSANYGQTQDLHATYEAGGWDVDFVGSNQAQVMRALQGLLATSASALRGRLRIAPITTIYSPATPGVTHADVIDTDLARIQSLLEDGWTVLGWRNESSGAEYAIGGKGGVAGAAYPPELRKVVQARLAGFAADFPA